MSDHRWVRIGVTYEFDSPLHVGYLASGGSVIARTRYYLPGKNFWGAVTKRATECLFPVPTGKDYRTMGQRIRDCFRFSYCFIVEDEQLYCPYFTDKGLVYGTSDKIPERLFKYRFVGSRVSTRIDSSTGAAALGSLHEVEYIKSRYKDKEGDIWNTRVSGFVWMRENTKLPASDGETPAKVTGKGILVKDQHNLLDGLLIGGEQSSGFGRIRIVEATNGRELSFGTDILSEDEVVITVPSGEPVPSHVRCFSEPECVYSTGVRFEGDIELISGREYSSTEKERLKGPGSRIVPPDYGFVPGTTFAFATDEASTKIGIDLQLQYDGTMKFT